jgi:hypothetical protein
MGNASKRRPKKGGPGFERLQVPHVSLVPPITFTPSRQVKELPGGAPPPVSAETLFAQEGRGGGFELLYCSLPLSSRYL